MSISIVENCDNMLFMGKYPDNFFDLAIVDPPYGNKTDVMNIANGGKHSAKRSQNKLYENIAPDQNYFDELKRVSKNQIIWGVNFFGIVGGYICWNKNGTAFGQAELAYCSKINSVSVFEYTWNGMLQGNMKNKETRIHTHQKPIALYYWLLQNYAKDGDKILDTHLGSGSSRIAAYDLGFDFYGCELDKDYYEAQEKRFAKHISQTKLFTPIQQISKQTTLL